MTSWSTEQAPLVAVLAFATVLAGLVVVRMIAARRRTRGGTPIATPSGPGMTAARPAPAPQLGLSGVQLFPLRLPVTPLAAKPEAETPAPSPSRLAQRPPPRARREAADPSLNAGELYEMAQARLTAGAREEAAAHFRGCIRAAQKGKLHALEARARIALGDLARSNGDLTSACEHWQMARVLFAAMNDHADVTATIERMESAGCPTDWVLNEF